MKVTSCLLVSLALAGLAPTALCKGKNVPKSAVNAYKYGYAYDIGLNSKICIDCGQVSFSWLPDTNFTYQTWIKPHVLSSDRIQQVVGNIYSGKSGFFNHGIVIEENYIGLRAGSYNSVSALSNSPRYDLSSHLFKWTHVTASFETNSATQIIRLYIDGESAGTKYDVGKLQKIEAAVMVGSSSGNLHYTGLVDEVRLFNHVLTEEEVNDTWSRSLTQEELDSGDVLFYFNADGERYNEPKDKSKYHRPCGWVTDPALMSLANRSSVVANCKGNFTSDMISFCVPYEADFGYCGDDIVMGDEECDNGEGCVNCKCAEGYTAHGLPYCKKLIDGLITMDCVKSTAIGMCSPSMDYNKCNCSCFIETGIKCLLKQNCNSDTINYELYTTWEYCHNICPGTDVCYDIIPDLCARFSTADTCRNNNLTQCTWCNNFCTSMSTSCPYASEGEYIIDGDHTDLAAMANPFFILIFVLIINFLF